MNERHTLVRSLHDVGAAVWLGGSLMGAVGLNGASRNVMDSGDRVRVAASGWARWAPFSAAAIGAQWATPVLTAGIVALGSQQGEQQRPSQMLGGFTGRVGAKVARFAGR
jgi:hypothetical protein